MSKSRDIADSAATINYIDGLTSDAQGQLNDKATLDGSPTFTGTVTATAFSGDGSGLTGVDSLPSQTGNSGKFLTTDGTNPSWDDVAAGFNYVDQSLSGLSSFTFTGIPSGTKQIFIGLHRIKAGGSNVEFRLGSGSIDSSNTYSGFSVRTNDTGAVSSVAFSDGISLRGLNGEHSGTAILSLVDDSNNIWAWNCQTGESKYGGAEEIQWGAGGKTLSGSLDRILIKTAGGSNFPSSAIISISYL